MKPYHADDAVTVYHGDCLDVLRELPDASIDAVVTDPPYGLEFMGKEWDGFKTYAAGGNNMKPKAPTVDQGSRTANYGYRQKQSRCRRCGKLMGRGTGVCKCPEPIIDTRTAEGANQFQFWCEQWAAECLRVLKPGGHLLAFGGTRTYHRLACAVEDAGFEIRDSIAWLYGSGFPKSLDVSKAIDKAAGAERETTGRVLSVTGNRATPSSAMVTSGLGAVGAGPQSHLETIPATPAAQQWAGWGTALKPSHEPVVVARRPLAGTVAANVLQYGTGALNVDGCRVEGPDEITNHSRGSAAAVSKGIYGDSRAQGTHQTPGQAAGRWPPNVVLDPAAAAELDRQSGTLTSGALRPYTERHTNPSAYRMEREKTYEKDADSGGASRFFYVAKAPTSERPHHWTNSCDCEDAWPTPSPARATSGTTSRTSSSTSKSGNLTTADPSPMGTRSTTSTETSRTTTQPTSSQSPRPTTNGSTQAASSATATGGSPAGSAASSSPSASATGTSRAKAGPSMGGAGSATSPAWSQTSVCGECGAPARREAHATVKPLDLMRWLVRLVTPPGGVVLDPFAGSGTTAEACLIEGFRCITIERETDYLPLIMARLSKPIEPVLDLGGFT